MNAYRCRIIIMLALLCLATACQKSSQPSDKNSTNKLSIVTTLFPIYDFAKTICGDKATVTILLPPGMEAHSYQPKPDDVIRISKADIFIFTNKYMEPWAVSLAGNASSGRLLLVDAGDGVTFLKNGAEDEHSHDHGAGMDPHTWLDFTNAEKMVHNITTAACSKAPANCEYFKTNEVKLVASLNKMDNDFKTGLKDCKNRTFLHGGHYTFGYLANRYSLHYESAAAVNADAEPTATSIISLLTRIRSLGLTSVYSEEMISPRTANLIAHEAGVSILMLHGAHNISKDDLKNGTTFEMLMRKNLENLRTGLQCR